MIRKPTNVTTLTGRSHYLKKVEIPEFNFPTERLYEWVKGLRGRKAMLRGTLLHSLINFIVRIYVDRQSCGAELDQPGDDDAFTIFIHNSCKDMKLPFPLVDDLPDFLDRLQCILLAYVKSGTVSVNVPLKSDLINGSADMIVGSTLVEFKSGQPRPEEDTIQILHYIRLATENGYDIQQAEIVYLTYETPIVRISITDIYWTNIKIV